MKLVLFADLHLDAPFRWAPISLGRKLRLGLRETLDRICRLAAEGGADALLCGGDLYEQENFTPDTAEFLRATFSNIGSVPVFIAPGNHDWYGPISLYRQVAWSPNVHIFAEGQLAPVQIGENVALWGAAHRSPANTGDFLQNFHANGARWNVALFHGSERGFFTEQGEGKAPHAAFRESEVHEAGLIHAFVGHYHQPKETQWLTYPGSPQALAFGEGEGGAIVIELENGNISRERVDVSSMPFTTVQVNVSGAASMSEIIDRVRVELAGIRGVVRVILYGTLATTVDLKRDDIKSAFGDLDGMVVQARVQEAYDLEAIAKEQTVSGQFVRDVGASELDESEKRRVLAVGLRALDNRGDLDPLEYAL